MFGLVRPKAAKNAASPAKGGHQDDDDAGDLQDSAGGEEQEQDAGEARISNSLMMSISEKQTLAASKTLAASPGVALLLAVAGLRSYSEAPIKISSQGWHGGTGGIENGHGPFAEVIADLADKDLTVELARALSHTLDLRRYAANDQAFGRRSDTPGIEALVSALPGALYLTAMREEFDAGNYFKRAPAAVIRAAIAEMTRGKRDLGDKVKKADLVEIATGLAGPTGWLPEELRHPDYALTIDQAPAAPAPAKGRRKARAA
jgi:hypothetical protein